MRFYFNNFAFLVYCQIVSECGDLKSVNFVCFEHVGGKSTLPFPNDAYLSGFVQMSLFVWHESIQNVIHKVQNR